MLLLILFAGCLASCAGQAATTTSPPTSAPTTTTTGSTTFTQLQLTPTTIQPTSVRSASASGDDVVAIILASVQTNHPINETTIAVILQQLQDLNPNLSFSLTVKNITRV